MQHFTSRDISVLKKLLKKRNPYYKNTLCKFKQKQQTWGLWCNCFPNISDAKPIQFSLIHVMPVHTSSCLRVIYIFQSLVRSLLVLAFLPGIHRQDLYCKVRTLQNESRKVSSEQALCDGGEEELPFNWKRPPVKPGWNLSPLKKKKISSIDLFPSSLSLVITLQITVGGSKMWTFIPSLISPSLNIGRQHASHQDKTCK